MSDEKRWASMMFMSRFERWVASMDGDPNRDLKIEIAKIFHPEHPELIKVFVLDSQGRVDLWESDIDGLTVTTNMLDKLARLVRTRDVALYVNPGCQYEPGLGSDVAIVWKRAGSWNIHTAIGTDLDDLAGPVVGPRVTRLVLREKHGLMIEREDDEAYRVRATMDAPGAWVRR